ncbi:MAG: rod shape-determining protein [Firmicutes bacterium]|nr:rod shape-determining protein [Bacillota bacterium]
MKKALGIDLGTANILVYMKDAGIVVEEPSVVAIDTETEEVVAVGEEAKQMLGRTPDHIRAERPIKEGVIADYTSTKAMLQYYIRKVAKPNFFMRPDLVICAPYGITDVEKRALIEVALQSGVNERGTYLMEEPMAAAIGAGLPVMDPVGSMVVDIGGGTTEVAVISLGGIVESKSLRVGGDAIDEAIMVYLKKINNMNIGDISAEHIKTTIGTAYVDDNTYEDKLIIKGRDVMTGLPLSMELTNFHVAEAIYPTIMQIINAITDVLEKLPPEIASDVYDNGIYLTGGGALLKGMDTMIEKVCGVKTVIAENPLHCVVNGCGIVLDNIQAYKGVLETASLYH